ncbi:helix-turn-helix transcriptional regulator [Acinetobacter baumannii]|uniref:helix-turn-helix domain-containing protein n=1 Tax=Acinetobacter calcoaceticus/baumannii complex TaxID=909768 RepID=UPI0018DD4F31|nr:MULTISPECIES: helix-turn-helix transcriptional regulator [Acinetobacter calcoaceticus/baumannii complex]MDH2546096.1 helix-turn-helix transcriptional regulator [Acinetobacter baumannii]MDO7188327.1 helix-turn-helix transcriptional regulator [Acinetobacter baumannii]MDO7209462.1 helix-turn-helix transcriptional regulator [Acinetobacter nosocomialis]MDO7231459.1 helix-turn-helix transcriptional regulator [Acinetobacter nosocomialis]MDO7435675.1 helix-turn-helix transcriptional regulator [Acin
MNDLAKKIGHAIRICRVDQKITQEKLALLCNIDRSYLGRIERGEVNITVLKLYEIAYILKVEPQILLPKD